MKFYSGLKAALTVGCMAVGLLSTSGTADAGIIGRLFGCGSSCSYPCYTYCCSYSYQPLPSYCGYDYGCGCGYGYGYWNGYGYGCGCGYGYGCGRRGRRGEECGCREGRVRRDRGERQCRERRSGGRRRGRRNGCSTEMCGTCESVMVGNPCHEDSSVGCGRRGRRGRRANGGGRRGRRNNTMCCSVDSCVDTSSCIGETTPVVEPSCAAPCHVECGEPCYADHGCGRMSRRQQRKLSGGRRSRRNANCCTVESCSVVSIDCASPCHCEDVCGRGRRGRRAEGGRRARRNGGWEVCAESCMVVPGCETPAVSHDCAAAAVGPSTEPTTDDGAGEPPVEPQPAQ
jgi:hypothetical protein